MGKHSTMPARSPHGTSPAAAMQDTTVLSLAEVTVTVGEGLKASRTAKRQQPQRTSAPRQRHPRVLTGFAASTMVSAGLTALIGISTFGGVSAQASQPLTASIVGGTSAQATTPAALQGSDNAALKSQVSEAKQQSESSSATTACTVTGAQGVRTAFASESSNTVVMPLTEDSYTVTSPFGYRFSPFSGEYSFHAGVDLAADAGTPIHAIADGVVTYAGPGIDGRSNNLIIVKHTIDGHVYESWYVHMYDDGVLVSAGDKVSAGDVIGLVGSNGNSTGPHLHLEIHDPSRASSNKIDELLSPLTFLSSHAAKDPADICR